MKYVFVFIMILASYGCQKTYCWRCSSTSYLTQGSTTTSSRSDFDVCDKTEEEIRAYEKQASFRSSSGNVSQVVVVTCNR